MPPIKCSYWRCTNTSKDFSLFRFPTGHASRLEVWLSNCGNMEITHLSHQELRNRYLCITHFDDKFIRNKTGIRKRITKLAVPQHYKDEQFPDMTPHTPSPSTSQGLIMEDDTSNDVEAVEYIDSQDEDDPDGGEERPIMLLLRRLIRNKQNTVMTNAQIIDILQSEFNICVKSSHELEVDIYIKIIKKYLKDWPQWEELERISTKLTNIKDFEAIAKVLNHKYKNLKEYLGVMLEAAKPLAREAAKTIKVPEDIKMDENIDSSDVVMEIQCTKEQLNHLVFRRPRLDLNNTVFNMSNVTPSRVSLKSLSFKQILNGWCVKLNIFLPHFWFERHLMYKLKHVLVNKVRNESFADVTLPTTLQTLRRDHVIKTTKTYKRELIIKQFSDILLACGAQSYELYSTVHPLFDFLMSELRDILDENVYYEVPARYRKYANKHKYVRYLYAENEQSDDPRYDLQLEETAAPSYNFNIMKIGNIVALPPITEWLKFECMFCKAKLPISLPCIKVTLESHFNEVHQNEADWQCTHCKMLFSIDYLSNNKWYHKC